MVDFIKRRLQVFVSSTYKDLKNERQSAVESILTAGHIPAGMELFSAGNESQMEVIKQWIDESDVYLLILGGRYGCIEPNSGLSYTHLEYKYALEQNKPLFACVINEDAIEPRVKANGLSFTETKNPHKLKAFRALVLSKMSDFWSDEKDIIISINKALAQFGRGKDLIGWVRTSEQADVPALAEEIARLSKENSILRGQVDAMEKVQICGIPYEIIREYLEQKMLVSKLLKARKIMFDWCNIHDAANIIDEALLNELCGKRLMEKRVIKERRDSILPSYTYLEYKLTDDCLKFLSYYELADKERKNYPWSLMPWA
jgi:hypothetical protein